MQLTTLDWIVIALYGLTALAIGLRFARRAGSGADEFFLSGRKLPWWLLGTSMVATTFSTDTPNLIADFVRTGGGRAELGLVGVPDHRDVHGLLLRPAVAQVRRADRHRVLRTALCGASGGVPAGVPRDLPGRLLQRDDHRHGDARRDQDRRRAAGARPAHHRADRGFGDRHLLPRRRGSGASS